MKRKLTFEEISDGRKYKADDLVKVSCNGCKGCSECCEVTDDTILLDPYDMFLLESGLHKSFEELQGSVIDLTVVDGVITPYLKKQDNTHACTFLNKEGFCDIHGFRPGFCRLFPLGRIYDEDGNFDYFIQVHECPYPNKTKVKVKQWLGIDNLPRYEAFIRDWHSLIKNITECFSEDPASDLAKQANMKMLMVFFVTPYDSSKDFYSQYEERINKFMN